MPSAKGAGLWSRLRAAFSREAPAPARRHFDGGAVTRLTMDWVRSPLSADRELDRDFVRLRARTRDLTRNNGYGKRFLRMARAHIVGPKGVQLRPSVRMGDGMHETANDAIAAAWKDWGRPEHASASGRLSWIGLQRLAVSEWASCGEALFLVRYDRAAKYGLWLQPIDADRLDYEFCQKADARTGALEIRHGVELTDAGRPVAYHILDVHPSEIGSSFGRQQARRRIPAEQVIHLYLNDDRVELTRGVPPLAVAMTDLRHLGGFQEAALVQARTAAAAMGFITTKSPDGDVTEPTEGLEFAAESGVIRELGIGQEFQSWDPNQPSDTYAGFVKAVLRGIGAGLGTSYAMLANDLSDANYSSMKVGRDEEQQTWQELQGWFIDLFCERVYAAWLPSAILSGALQVTMSQTRDIAARSWIPRRWASVDPVKDIEADERRVALGVSSRQQIAARDGDDLWDIIEQIADEEAYAAEEGVNIGPPRTAGGSPPNEDPNNPAGDASNDDASRGRGRTGHTRRRRRAHPDLTVVRNAG